ncbi:MAG: M1 family aminopeptidase, partial [Pyrinomonadaceae bacterium]
RTPIFDLETEELPKLLNANNYQKGAWVLHMLRASLGDKSFFRGLRAYYRGHKNSTASSEDLRIALEKASGRDLRIFFNSWVYGAGHPLYEFSWHWNKERRAIEINLKQLQPESFFPNPLAIDILTKQGKRRLILRPESKETVRDVRLTSAPVAVQLDPDNTVLKEVSPSRIASGVGISQLTARSVGGTRWRR